MADVLLCGKVVRLFSTAFLCGCWIWLFRLTAMNNCCSAWLSNGAIQHGFSMWLFCIVVMYDCHEWLILFCGDEWQGSSDCSGLLFDVIAMNEYCSVWLSNVGLDVQ